MRNNENIGVLAGVLLVITAVVALLLGITNLCTADRIAEINLKQQTEARSLVCPGSTDFEKLDGSFPATVSEVYAAKNGSETTGWCISVNPVGFGGEINMVVGVGKNGAVSGVKIIKMSETAGLGAKAENDSFLEQYQGKAGGAVSVIKSGTAKENEIVAISGATITSKAVTGGINTALEVAAQLS